MNKCSNIYNFLQVGRALRSRGYSAWRQSLGVLILALSNVVFCGKSCCGTSFRSNTTVGSLLTTLEKTIEISLSLREEISMKKILAAPLVGQNMYISAMPRAIKNLKKIPPVILIDLGPAYLICRPTISKACNSSAADNSDNSLEP